MAALRGKKWSEGLERNAAVTDLATDGNSLYAASFAGVFRTPPAADTWQNVTGFPTNLYGVSALAASPDVVLAAAFGYGFGAQGALYRSTDSGESWAEQPLLTDPASAINAMTWTGSAFLAATNVYDGSGNALVYRSKDGIAWAPVAAWEPIPIHFLPGARVGVVFAGAGDALWISQDDGRTWTVLEQWAETDESISGLALFQDELYVALNQRSGGQGRLLRSALVGVQVAAEPAGALPSLALGPVSPNPVRASASAELSGPVGASVAVDVFDVTGRRVGSSTEVLEDASRVVSLPTGLAPGVYVVRAHTSGGTATRRFVVVD